MATANEAVRQMYLEQTGREADPGGLQYFSDRFGSEIDPEELYIFQKMAADEVNANAIRKEKLGTPYSGPLGFGLGDIYPPYTGGLNSPDLRTDPYPFFQPGTAMSSAQALDLMYKSSTGGVNTSEFDKYGGYNFVKGVAEAAGYSATPQFIQSYEIANNLPESASTKLNKQFIGSEGAAKMAQLEADLNSQNAALAAQTRANLAAQSAAADQQAAAEAAQRAAAANTADPGNAGGDPSAGSYSGGTTRTGTTAGTGMSITQAYQQVLGRTPSASEIAYWTTQFGSSVDPVELSSFSVAAQPELKTAAPTNTAIRDMYLSVLGREPDASGLQYFADRFGTSVDPTELGIFRGMAAQEIAANAAKAAGTDPGNAGGGVGKGNFIFDPALPEGMVGTMGGTGYDPVTGRSDLGTAGGSGQYVANARTGTGTTAGTGATTATGMSITQAYQQVLGRTPSASEIAYWTTQFGADVDAKELSTFSVAAQPERAAVPTTNNAVRQMYLSVLGREPDAAGLKYFSDRFGADVDASELGIFKGMSTQEINANAARNAGTTTNTAGAITRPTTPRQVTGTQLAPAAVTNTAITGTPYTNIYTPATMQQNAPTLAQINAASQSANPYQSLMALTPQRTLSPAYAAQAGVAGANTNLGGFDPKIYNPAATPVTGLLNTTTTGGNDGSQNGAGGGGGGGQTVYGSIANLAGEAQRAGFNTIGNFLGGLVPVGAEYNKIDPVTGLPAKGSVTAADLAALTGKFDIGSSVSLGGTGDGGGGYGSGSGPGGSGTGAGGYGPQYRGGLITPRDVKGPNPPGPDDGHASLDIGEYVIKKSAVKKYGSNIFEQINAGRIPAQRLKSLLE